MATLRLKLDPDRLVRGSRRAKDSLDGVKASANRTESAVERMSKNGGRSATFLAGKFKFLGAAVATAAVSFAAKGVAAFKEYDAALAEVSTLIDGTAKDMDLLSTSARGLAAQFGGGATQQVQAFYQAISAGADGVAGANDVLDAANKLAVGGVTDVTTGVKVLSGVINSYGSDVVSTTQASDALFVGMRYGVTTIGELSSQIGTVVPIAKALGLTFDETVAATSALTKNSLTTSAAVTSLNAALTSISGPTGEAKKLAKLLGIEFNAAGLQSKGFAEFMKDVAEKTGGNVTAMRTLFGSVEGMKAALLFAGKAGEQYLEIMDGMGEKAGETEVAFNKISKSLSNRLNIQFSILGNAAISIGDVLLNFIVPALESVTSAFSSLFSMIGTLGKHLGFTRDVTVTWTEAVDQQIQAEMDLEYALGQVTGSSEASAKAAIDAAAANLAAATDTYGRAKAEVALAKAIVARQSIEAGAARAAAAGGANIFFGKEVQAQAEEDYGTAVGFLEEMEKELGIRAEKVREAVAGVDQAIEIQDGGLKSWNPLRKEIEKVIPPIVDVSDALAAMGSSGPKEVKKVSEAMKRVQGVFDTIETSMTDSFMSMVDGTKSAGDAFRDMAKGIIAELYRVLVVQRLVGSFDASTGKGSGIVGMLSGVLTGTRAQGGSVTSGEPYLVGEGGPEMFVPSQSGKIIQNGGQPAQAINISYNFQGGVTQADLAHALPMLVEKTKRAMVDEVQRGGAIARTMRA